MLGKILKWALGVIAAIALLFIGLGVILEVIGYEPAGATAPSANPTVTPSITRTAANSPMVAALAENERRIECEHGGGQMEQTEQGLVCVPTINPTPSAAAAPPLDATPKPPRDPAQVLLLKGSRVRDLDPGEAFVFESEAQSVITYFSPPVHPDHYIVHSGTVDVDVSVDGRLATVTITAGSAGARISNVRLVGRTANSEQGNPDGVPASLPCFHHNLDTTDPQIVYAVQSAYDTREAAHPEDDYFANCEAIRGEFPDLKVRHDLEVSKAKAERKRRERERRFARLNDPDPYIRALERDLYCGSADWVEDGFALRQAMADFSKFPDAPPYDASDAEFAAHDSQLSAWQAEIMQAQQDFVNWLRFCE